jgi:hypothetical protein
VKAFDSGAEAGMDGLWSNVENAIVAFTFCWIVWVIFSSVRRYLIAKAKAGVQETVLARIDSGEALVSLAGSESGRKFLESLVVEEARPEAPFARILFGVQAGIVLLFFGAAMLLLHHHTPDPEEGFMIIGTGAIGIGLGFAVAAAASMFVSRRLGLMDRDGRA